MQRANANLIECEQRSPLRRSLTHRTVDDRRIRRMRYRAVRHTRARGDNIRIVAFVRHTDEMLSRTKERNDLGGRGE